MSTAGASGRDASGREVLAGGVANAGAVVRDGEHVLRPSNAHTPSIHRYLRFLRDAGFDGASVPIGVEADGRERLVFIAGDVAIPPYPAWVQTDRALASIARLLRRLHSAAEGFDASQCSWSDEMADPEGGAIVCHNDVCLENVVFRDGTAVGLLDFDFCAPGRPLWDLAQFTRMCVPVDDPESSGRLGWQPSDRAHKLRVVADAYGLDADGRSELLSILEGTIERGGQFVRRRVEQGDPNFIEMWQAMGGAERFDRRRRWYGEHRQEFVESMS